MQKVQVRFRFRPNAAEPFSKGSAMNRFGFSVTPIYRKTREVQFAAGGRQIAQTFPLIDTRNLCSSPIGPLSEHHKKVRRSTKGSVQVQLQPTPPSAMKYILDHFMHSGTLSEPRGWNGAGAVSVSGSAPRNQTWVLSPHPTHPTPPTPSTPPHPTPRIPYL